MQDRFFTFDIRMLVINPSHQYPGMR